MTKISRIARLKPVYRDLCCVAPAPNVAEAMARDARRVAENVGAENIVRTTTARPDARHHVKGFNDSVIYPPSYIAEISKRLELPPESPDLVQQMAPPTPQGEIRVAVILLDFEDNRFGNPSGLRDSLHEMLFSAGAYATGSLNDFYREVSNGKAWFNGAIVGPYRAPNPYTFYTNGRSGIGAYPNNAQRMVEDASALADPDIDFGPFDPNGDGYVDGLIVVHAGPGAEGITNAAQRQNAIWSHKWTISAPRQHDRVNLYAYLTVPEQSTIGVWAHELGHLIFGWPDLYDVDNSSEGLGNYCLMASGSWNAGGARPAHPSAWCKAKHNWVTVNTPNYDQAITISPVESSAQVFKLWTHGEPGKEYFLLENRQPIGFDDNLPDWGLAIYHIDDNQSDNSQESHYMVGLEQADGAADLENARNRGDNTDLWPEGGKLSFDAESTPDSNAYNGALSFVAVRNIMQDGQDILANISIGVETPPQPPPNGGDGGDGDGGGTIETTGCGALALAIMRALGWIK
ncbi:MAG: M6 family metalloprotease domain-containing protein [Anaerolineae bacterium]|nr:M6 family metalloprotease domain-containing protein [Anaerolineae bacterium]